MKRHITGQEIVELFEWTEHKLIEAVKGGLEPFDPIDDSRITKAVNPCLYCDGGKIVDHSIVLDNHICSDSGGLMSAPGGLMGEYESYTRMRLCTAINIPAGSLKGPWLCKDDWQRQELAKRLLKASFVTAEVQVYALAHGLPALSQTIPATEPAANEPVRNFKTPKEFADHYRRIEGVPAGWVMLELVERWGLKNYEAAAVALGDPVPDKGTEAAKSYGGRFRYHKELLDQGE